jgi:hypothetical protein
VSFVLLIVILRISQAVFEGLDDTLYNVTVIKVSLIVSASLLLLIITALIPLIDVLASSRVVDVVVTKVSGSIKVKRRYSTRLLSSG